MKILKSIFNILIAFFLSLLIILNFAIIVSENTILSKEYMMSKLEENCYYEKIETDLKNEFESYKYQSGLPEEVFDDIYSHDMVKSDIDSIIDNIYDGTEVNNNSDMVSQKITQNINEYLNENNIALTR